MSNQPPSLALPRLEELRGLLDLEQGEGVPELLSRSLLEPLQAFLNRPAKYFRSELVEIGLRLSVEGSGVDDELSRGQEKLIAIGSEVIESLHAGSLVVDDIEDGSEFRRGDVALHRQHGLPIALNAGNWLYFWPFQRIRESGVTPEIELGLYQVCHEVLLRAHFGQALDVGVRIDTLPQSEIPRVCLASLQLKSGALTELALSIGGVLGGASKGRGETLAAFGRAFGIALQMFDDIGNLTGKSIEDPKRCEDLRLRRPSWVWAVAALESNERFSAFRRAVAELPNEGLMQDWMNGSGFMEKMKRGAREHLNGAVSKLEAVLTPREATGLVVGRIRDLSGRLARAYE